MRIRLRRLDHAHHLLCVETSDGAWAQRELETRSVLLHDFMHFALEAESGLSDGFWGLLASGMSFDEVLEQAQSPSLEGIMRVEKLVGPLQAVWQGRYAASDYLRQIGPDHEFADVDFVDRVLERIRKLWGHWKATPFHEAMELECPPRA